MMESMVTNVKMINLGDIKPYVTHYSSLGIKTCSFYVSCIETEEIMATRKTIMTPKAIRNRNEVFDFLERRG